MPNAAVGFRVHSGWAAMVAVSLQKGEPVVLARKRAHLVENFSYTFRQPYHTAEKMEVGNARAFVTKVRAEAQRLAAQAMREVGEETQQQGVKLTRCALLLASGRELPELEKILASHALIHTADGELFREAIAQGSAKCGLEVVRIREKELLEQAKKALRVQSAALLKHATELGKPLGSPWSQDEKFAALGAWVALLSR